MKSETESDFIEALGIILQRDGLPRIAGRLLGVFVLHGGPFSFSELSLKLKVSRGSISTNTRLLEELGAIERVARPGERQDYFQLAEEPYVQLIERWIARSRKAQETIGNTTRSLEGGDPESRDRLLELTRFYDVMAEASEGALLRLRKSPEDGAAAPKATIRAL